MQFLFDWIQTYPLLALVGVFIVSLAESIAIVGLFIPGLVVMGAIGVLIGSGLLHLHSALFMVVVGAILGDVLSFAVGRYYQDTILESWPFKYFQSTLKSGQDYFYTHGGKSVFIGRFLGPLRPILPIVAGMLNMSWKTFLIADITSAILWAPLYILPGVLITTTTLHTIARDTKTIAFALLGSILLLWLISWGIERLKRRWYPISLKLWKSIYPKIEHQSLLKYFSFHPLNPNPMNHFLLCIAYAILFIAITSLVIMTEPSQWTKTILAYLQTKRSVWGDEIMLNLTLFGEKYVMILFYLFLCIYFLVMRAKSLALLWLIHGAILGGGTFILKYGLEIARPLSLALRDTFSYPSAHVSLTVGLLGFYYMLIQYRLRPFRWYAFTPIVGICSIVAFSRMYLGAHWITDIVGGLLFGLCCMNFGCIFLYSITIPKRVFYLILPAGFGALLCAWIIVYLLYGHIEFASYHRV